MKTILIGTLLCGGVALFADSTHPDFTGSRRFDAAKSQAHSRAPRSPCYYNGPTLIETDVMGHEKDRVVKKRIKLGEDGKTMEVEVQYINPKGDTERLVFDRQ